MPARCLSCLLLSLAFVASPVWAQDLGTLDPKPLPPLTNPNDPNLPAKELFARKLDPAAMPPRSIGFYAKGCIAGAVALPINGPTWQVMRLSRNRNWGHPKMIALLERLSEKAKKVAGWPGLLVGDISQPRGGPMFTGHASHQVGLDADVWLTPMPERELSRQEREEMSATMMVAESRLDVDPKVWTPGHTAVIKAAAEEPAVERIFVNAAIKKALCREASGNGNRAWLHKVRPMYGHDYHFHIRIKCPAADSNCKPQDPVPGGDGCSAADLSWWFQDSIIHPKPSPAPVKPSKGLTMAQLPAACRTVVMAP
jgi:penicillin-insensitive murein endopeptidase